MTGRAPVVRDVKRTHAPLVPTPRQEQVLELLLDGMGNQEIAAVMGLSRSTVRNYVTDLMSHYTANNRVRLARAAVMAGDAPCWCRRGEERRAVLVVNGQRIETSWPVTLWIKPAALSSHPDGT